MSHLTGLLGVCLSWLLHGVGTGPVETETRESAETCGEQLARLKLLHTETGHLIGRIQSDLDRLAASSAR